MRVRVIVGFVTQHYSTLFERTNDKWICFEHLKTRVVGNFLSEFASAIHWHYEFNAVLFAHLIVVFTKTRRHMYNTSSVFRGNKLAAKHTERTRTSREIRKERRVTLTNKIRSANSPQHFRPIEFFRIGRQPRFSQHIHPVVVPHTHVINIWCNSQCKVARQCPWRGRPSQQIVAGLQHKGNGERWVLHHFVCVVHARFGIGKRCFKRP